MEMGKLLQMLDSLISRIEARKPRIETAEWYLLNNLHRFKDVAESSSSQREFEKAQRVLSRFCVDSMDWDDPLFKEINAITTQARRMTL
jgi:hypothetical protein